MWSRRRFLESISSLPIVGGLVGAGSSATAVVSEGSCSGNTVRKSIMTRPSRMNGKTRGEPVRNTRARSSG